MRSIVANLLLATLALEAGCAVDSGVATAVDSGTDAFAAETAVASDSAADSSVPLDTSVAPDSAADVPKDTVDAAPIDAGSCEQEHASACSSPCMAVRGNRYDFPG